ncbi:MAG: hypothetical protein JNL36_10410 [Candidatus Kapabacteria bacterium]|nr:hypothetical protein [Candidatus Kapabacteria bacterium]
MKVICLFTFIICISSSFSQTKKNIFDENVLENNVVFIIKRVDGSIFEFNGKSTWTEINVLPSSKYFSKFVNAQKPLTIEYETLSGEKYSIVNNGTWSKTQNQFQSQGPLSLTAEFNKKDILLEIGFKLFNVSFVEISLLSINSPMDYNLFNQNVEIGQHRFQIPLKNIPNGEYQLVLRTFENLESMRIIINN